MNKIQEKMNAFVEKIIAFTEMRYMKVIMNGFMGVTAITICGSLFTLIKSIPFDPWLNFLSTTGLGNIISLPVAITTDVIALYVVLSMANQTAKSFDYDGFSAALVGLGSFLLLTPFTTTVYNADYTVATEVSNVISLNAIGAQGVFLAIIVGIVAARIYVFFLKKGWKIKMPDSVPQNVACMFESLIPGGMVFIFFLGIRYGLSLTDFGTAQNLVYGLLQKPLTLIGGGVFGLMIYHVVGSFLWWFGVHGNMVCYVGMLSVIQTMTSENLAAFAAGANCPHPEWAAFSFVLLGGAGATLSLNLLMVSPLCKSEQFKALGKLALPSSLFNISEPMTFGTPIIMNPFLFIPFILAPAVNILLCVIGYNIGFFIPTGANINMFMPFLLYGAFLTSSWNGAVMQLIMLIVDILIYLPFFKIVDRNNFKMEQVNKVQSQL